MRTIVTPWIMTQLTHPKFARISRAEERKLFAAFRAGDPRAEEKIIAANTRFVVQVAMKYLNRGLELEDLIGEGLLGLRRALLRFDENTGFKFISYAVWWVRQAMMTALASQGRSIALPTNLLGSFMKIAKALNRLNMALERNPTVEELATAARVRPAEVEDFYRYCIMGDVSLDYQEPDEDGVEGNLGMCLQDSGPLPDARHGEEQAQAHRKMLLSHLKPIEREILLRYHGLTNHGEQTLEEISHALGLTRERIRQIKEKALDRVRYRARAIHLQGRLDMATLRAVRRAGPVSIGQARNA